MVFRVSQPFLRIEDASGQLDEKVEAERVVTGILRCRIASGLARGVVTVKAFAVSEVRGTVLVTVIFVVTGSRHLPNQPHFIQVVVVAVIVSVVIGVVVVVLSSRQPHQPGVWQVVVRVRLMLDDLLLLLLLDEGASE